MLLNDPALVQELTRLHDLYEMALIKNDVAVLNQFFWDSPATVRFGVNEHLYGAQAVAAYRQGNAPVFSDRTMVRRTVLVVGDSTASIMCEFTLRVFGQLKHSRQSQLWIRLPELGWKIAHAHVSNALTAPAEKGSWEAFVDQAAAAAGLPLDPVHRPGVIQNLERAAIIVQPLLAVKFADDVELAPTFEP